MELRAGSEGIALLDDPDPEVVLVAAGTLAKFGGASVEPHLWKRLERWSERWKGRTEELLSNPITGVGPRAEQQLESALFRAIGSATAWLPDEPRQKRLLELCIDDDCRQAWGHDLLTGALPVHVSSGGELYLIRVSSGGIFGRYDGRA